MKKLNFFICLCLHQKYWTNLNCCTCSSVLINSVIFQIILGEKYRSISLLMWTFFFFTKAELPFWGKLHPFTVSVNFFLPTYPVAFVHMASTGFKTYFFPFWLFLISREHRGSKTYSLFSLCSYLMLKPRTRWCQQGLEVFKGVITEENNWRREEKCLTLFYVSFGFSLHLWSPSSE